MVKGFAGYITPNIDVHKILSDQLCEAKAEALREFKLMTIEELKEFNEKYKKDETKTR